MALTDENGGIGATMLVGPTGYGAGMPYPVYQNGSGNNGGWGGDWGWIILLLLLAGAGGWGNGMGGFGGNQLGYDFPWVLNGQQNIMANTNNGFRDQMINDGITSIRDGIGNLSTQLCGCCSDMQMALANGFAGVEQGANTRQIANMQQAFAAQTAMSQGFNGLQGQLAQCCCDNRLATAQTQALVQSENCADRYEAAQNTSAIIQAINGGIQAIKDDLCQDRLDAERRENANLRSELMFARGQASQDVQTAAIQAGQRALANEVEQYILPTPRPAYIVQNPNCCYNPCGTNCGCGVA